MGNIDQAPEYDMDYREKIIKERELKIANANRVCNELGSRRISRSTLTSSVSRACEDGKYNRYRSSAREPEPGQMRTRYTRGIGLYREHYSPGEGWQRGEVIRSYESVVNEGRERTRKYEAKLAKEKSRHERGLMFVNNYDKLHGLPPEARARAAKIETDAWEQERNGTTPTPVELAEAHPMRYSYGEKLDMYKQSRERGDPMPEVQTPEGFQSRYPGGRKAPEQRMESQASFDEWHRGLFEKSRNPDNFTDPKLKEMSRNMQNSSLTYEMYRSVVDMQSQGRYFYHGVYDRNGNGVLISNTREKGKCDVTFVDKVTGKTAEAKNVPREKVEQFLKEGTLEENIQKHRNYLVRKQRKGGANNA